MSTSPAAPPQPAQNLGSILRAFRLLASTSMLTLMFGIVTNKIIAVLAGPDGIATLNIYRNLTNFTIAFVSLGVTNVVVQRLSTSTDPEARKSVLVGLLRLVLVQIGVIVFVALFFAPSITTWLFGDATGRIGGMRVALLFIVGVLSMQTALEVLSGLTAVKQVARVSLVTSLLTMLTTYPLVRLGQYGIAMMIGLTCFVGAALALRHIARALPFSLRQALRSAPFAWSELPLSAAVALRGIVTTGVLLLVQSAIAHGYGTDALGVYTSASMLESNATLLLLGFMRPYYLPSLGTFTDDRAKHIFVNKVVEVLIVLAIPGIVALVLLSPLVLRILFSRAFAAGSDYLAILGISMLAQVLLYTYAFYLVHRAAYRKMLWVDCGWALFLGIGVVGCAVRHAPITAVAWTYTISYCVYAALYVTASMRSFGADILSRRNVGLLVAGFGWLVACYFVAHLGIGIRVGFATLTLLPSGLFARKLLREL